MEENPTRKLITSKSESQASLEIENFDVMISMNFWSSRNETKFLELLPTLRTTERPKDGKNDSNAVIEDIVTETIL